MARLCAFADENPLLPPITLRQGREAYPSTKGRDTPPPQQLRGAFTAYPMTSRTTRFF